MANVARLGGYGDTSGSGLMFRNKLINGGFDIWQRATSQTATGYGSDDRWSNSNSGSTKTASRQTFTLGQTDVPGNPKYWSRTVVSSVAGASNFCIKAQKIENVLTLAGQTATISFWAKADASKNIAVEIEQFFGTGGSPSSGVTSIGVTTCALTTVWQKFTITANIPSITGKTLGSNNDDFLAVNFWFDAGSSFNARTNSLGQQSGTFDIANVQLEAGDQPTPFEQRPSTVELGLCQRYCNLLGPVSQQEVARMCVYTSGAMFFAVVMPVTMRAQPTITSGGLDVVTTANVAQTGFSFGTNAGGVVGNLVTITATKAAHGLTDGFLRSTNAILSCEL